MINRSVILVLLLLSLRPAFGQYAGITEILENRLEEKEDEDPFHRVNLILSHQLNLDSLNEVFDADETPHKQRTLITVNALINAAEKSQEPLESFLDNSISEHPELIRYSEGFWISNLFVIEAKARFIRALQSRQDLALIDLDRDEFMKADPVEIVQTFLPESPNGKEPGHVAINAHKLWYKGYTGRGALGMIIDDGTYALHPALFKNFKGHYAPLSESYHGGKYPGCITSDSHGIHVGGTMFGHDPATRDTIGVAFNSYWIGSGETGGGCGSLGGIAAMQWTLNPDGNAATTNDVPDVLNCSWASQSGGAGTAQCNGTFVNILNSLETASVAVVFSAGNDGPNVSTITEPKNINTSLVNTFTVANLDGNSGSLPINFSSSRGPSVCGKTGSLLIKPEVSAPGTSVRSAFNANSYALLTGTSMAAPHVAGALLLLRGAFPNVSGRDLKLALYHSARDLGATGEDNVYGMGIIDVNAAFDSLAKNHTPNPPEQHDFDLSISGIPGPEKVICSNSLTPRVELVNYGTSLVSSARIEYWIDNGAKQSHNWTGVLPSRTSRGVALPALNFVNTPGTHTINMEVTLTGGGTDRDQFNNSFSKEFDVPRSINVPYSQNFEVSSFNSTNWLLYNPDFQHGWLFKVFNGANSGLRAMAINKFGDKVRGEKDAMYLPRVNVPANRILSIAYSYAHKLRSPAFLDTMHILISNDCGNSWTRVRTQFGSSLASLVGFQNSEFIPGGSSDYRRDTVDLSPFISSSQVLIKFEVVNRNGNSIYVDDVSLLNSGSTDVSSLKKGVLNIYPNPGQGNYSVLYSGFSASFLKYTLRSSIGNVVLEGSLTNEGQGKFSLDNRNVEAGIYLLEVSDNDQKYYKRLVQY